MFTKSLRSGLVGLAAILIVLPLSSAAETAAPRNTVWGQALVAKFAERVTKGCMPNGVCYYALKPVFHALAFRPKGGSNKTHVAVPAVATLVLFIETDGSLDLRGTLYLQHSFDPNTPFGMLPRIFFMEDLRANGDLDSASSFLLQPGKNENGTLAPVVFPPVSWSKAGGEKCCALMAPEDVAFLKDVYPMMVADVLSTPEARVSKVPPPQQPAPARVSDGSI